MNGSHPFYSGTYNGHDCYCVTSEDRIKRVREFDLETCRRALLLPDLQSTVRKAIECQARKLVRAAKPKKPPPAAKFAVVLNPGTLFQAVDIYCGTLKSAEEWARGAVEPGVEVDVMRVLPDGSLTTEL